ncbi:ABC transporter permease [Pseudomonas helleri]|uniref:ABC transporter permease n=1 Tax=Pseudomonas helleri TaxID=1608996 RepID=UPI003342A444
MTRVTSTKLLRKLAQVVLVLLGTITLNFFLLRLAPGDAVDVLVGEMGAASPEYIAALRQQFGLDQPLWMQYLKYLWELLHLDLGHSFRYDQSILSLILERTPATLLLMMTSLGLAVSVGCILGAIAARHSGRWPDLLISTLSMLFHATPLFWVGLMLIVAFAIEWAWLPIGGMFEIRGAGSFWGTCLDLMQHLILPTVTLGLFYLGVYVRLMRATLLEISEQDYLRTAVSKGLSKGRIFRRHMLRNAWLPVVTMLGTQVASVLSGSVLVETVFSWPGLGRLAYDALFSRDLNLLLGILLFCTVLVLMINFVVDGIYQAIDPRIEAN